MPKGKLENGPAASHKIPNISIDELIRRYEVLFFDAFGVLIHTSGAYPGAAQVIERLNAEQKPYFILTNGAAKLPETSAARYQAMGLAIPPERVITSGSLLAGYFAEQSLVGAGCVVLGPADSKRYVEQAGGRVVGWEQPENVDAVVICDEAGFSFLEAMDAVLTLMIRKFDAGKPPALILPNPDLIYSSGEDSYGVTSGSMALIFEAALRLRYGESRATQFVRLGKPYPAIYEDGLRRSGLVARFGPSEAKRRAVMIGDQVPTDIKGARDLGIDSALVGTGLTRLDDAKQLGAIPPTYLMSSLCI